MEAYPDVVIQRPLSTDPQYVAEGKKLDLLTEILAKHDRVWLTLIGFRKIGRLAHNTLLWFLNGAIEQDNMDALAQILKLRSHAICDIDWHSMDAAICMATKNPGMLRLILESVPATDIPRHCFGTRAVSVP